MQPSDHPSPFNLGLIGYPLGHSLSPQLHHAALQAMQVSGTYRLFPIPPLPDGRIELADMLQRLRSKELDGLNVTIPHKPNVLGLLDELTPLARRAGSANTLFIRGGRLIGDTTDVPGLWDDIAGWLPAEQAAAKTALILGAGGSARAAVVALQEAGWRLWIAARRPAQAEELAGHLGGEINILSLDASALSQLNGIGLIVNTTPAGMYPKMEGCPWPDELSLPEGAAVYDLIYNPAETVLLRRARGAGLPARNGAGMLVGQAALSLERWTGLPVPREAMWAAFNK